MIHISQLVVGDIFSIKQGMSIPADCLVIEANYLYVNEALITGEVA